MSEFKELSRSVKGGHGCSSRGAAAGMGRATARVFAAEGAHVAVTDFNGGGGAEAVAAELRAKGQCRQGRGSSTWGMPPRSSR